MKKTLSIIAAAAFLIPVMENYSDAQIRGRVRRSLDSMMPSSGDILKGIIDDFFNKKEDPVKAYEKKREREAKIFGLIIEYNNKNHTKEGDIVRKIVEDPEKYQESISETDLKKYTNFYTDLDEKENGKKLFVEKYFRCFPWRLFQDRLDDAEKHLLYNLHILEEKRKSLPNFRDMDKYIEYSREITNYKTTLYPPLVSDFDDAEKKREYKEELSRQRERSIATPIAPRR